MRKIIALLALLAVATPALALERGPQYPERAMKQAVKVERGEAKTVAREKISVAKEVFSKVREDAKKELKTKLAKIKDTRKRDAVQRIDDNIAALNKKITEHDTGVLSKLSATLGRISERADRAATKGVDVVAAKTAIADAKTAISNANASIKTQAEKVYKLEVADEATLKQKVGEIRQMLRNDLTALFDVVKGSRELVRKAATTLAQTPRVKDEAPEVVPPAAITGAVSPTN